MPSLKAAALLVLDSRMTLTDGGLIPCLHVRKSNLTWENTAERRDGDDVYWTGFIQESKEKGGCWTKTCFARQTPSARCVLSTLPSSGLQK